MSRIRNNLVDRRGIAAIELALVLPVLLVLMLGGFDLTVWIRSGFRLDETASSMGEVISQCNAINDPADIQQFQTNAQLLAGTTDISSANGGAFIISAVGTNNNNQLAVLWQRRSGNSGYGSHIGPAGGSPSLGAYVPPVGEVLITTEVFAGVQPWKLSKPFMSAVPLPPTYSSAMFLVRSGNSAQLTSLTPSNNGTLACAS